MSTVVRCGVLLYVITNVSEEYITSIFRVEVSMVLVSQGIGFRMVTSGVGFCACLHHPSVLRVRTL
jgi:hypothetical protein